MTTLNQRIIAILLSPAALGIKVRLSYPEISVDDRTFRRVANEIIFGRLEIVPSTSLPPGAAAKFVEPRRSSDNPRIEVRASAIMHGSVDDIIHEAVHASLYLTGCHLQLLSEESACYITHAVYRRRRHLPRARSRENDAIFLHADRVARTIVAGNPIDGSALVSLRAAISADPLYAGQARQELHSAGWGAYPPL